jgi:two-component system sensor histidine kinase and response regulator WspE
LYAFPLTGLSGVLKCPKQDVESLEGRQFIKAGDQRLGLVAAQEVFNLDCPSPEGEHLEIILLSEGTEHYGLVVNRLVGEQDISVRSLDPRLGKIKDISGAGLTQEGAVVFIVELEHLTHSIEAIVRQGPPARVTAESGPTAIWRRRILVVEDSLTVRELERKLLQSEGYHVDFAVDGMEGWNAAQNGEYDLIVTDVDMPRLDGIRLVTMLKNDPRLRSIPVIIVSYKSRPEDRVNGLEAGADYYLSKESFHDESLLRAVADLIGEEKS